MTKSVSSTVHSFFTTLSLTFSLHRGVEGPIVDVFALILATLGFFSVHLCILLLARILFLLSCIPVIIFGNELGDIVLSRQSMYCRLVT